MQHHAVNQLIACENFPLFKRLMISRNTALNQKALREMELDGFEVPEEYQSKADYDAEEAELQRAIAESKAMMEMMSIADHVKSEKAPSERPSKKAMEKMQKAEDEKVAQLEKMRKDKEDKAKANPMDDALPDIFAKPGQFLPNILEGEGKGEFDNKNLDKTVVDKAGKIQSKLEQEKQKQIEEERKKRMLTFKQYVDEKKDDEPKEKAKKERVK